MSIEFENATRGLQAMISEKFYPYNSTAKKHFVILYHMSLTADYLNVLEIN
jgi:hypothetical protein